MIRHYETLHLKPSATQEQIRQAYLDLARVWHPDRFVNDERLRRVAEEKMMEITGAYQALLGAPAAAPAPAVAAREPAARVPPTTSSASQTSTPLLRDPRLQVAGGSAALAVILLIVWWLVPPGGDAPQDPLPQTEASREAAVERQPKRPIRSMPATGEAMRSRTGAGEIQIHNQTNSEAVLRISTARNRSTALNTATVPAGDIAILRNLSPESYFVEATFSDRHSPPLHLGPFDILQTTTGNTVEADHYEITLKPRTAR